MENRDNSSLFNSIATVYGLFYKKQKRKFAKVMDDLREELDIASFNTILDVGCGTGALCSVLNEKGMKVTGIDPAEKMLEIARKKPENGSISFIRASVLEKLPFLDKSFDIVIASHVVHGLKAEERKRMYAQMSHIAKHRVVIYDYNKRRSLLINIIEGLERGDYFHFIRNAELEMKNCMEEMKSCFSEVKVINADVQAAWYICKPVV